MKGKSRRGPRIHINDGDDGQSRAACGAGAGGDPAGRTSRHWSDVTCATCLRYEGSEFMPHLPRARNAPPPKLTPEKARRINAAKPPPPPPGWDKTENIEPWEKL